MKLCQFTKEMHDGSKRKIKTLERANKTKITNKTDSI